LHRGDNAKLGVARNLLGRDDLVVLDAEAEVVGLLRAAGMLKLIFADRLLADRERLQGHFGAAVANGMEAELETGFNALACHAVQRLLIVLRKTSVIRIVRVWCEQSSGAGAERSVHKALQHAGMEHRVGLGMMGAMALQGLDRIAEVQPLADAYWQRAL